MNATKSIHVRLCKEAYQALAAYAHVHGLTLGGAAAVLTNDAIFGRARGMPRPPPKDESGYVYLIRCGNEYKIGKTKDVPRRIADMQLPSKPELIASQFCSEPHELERELHHLFKKCRTHGEWFALSVPEINQVRELLEGPDGKGGK